MSYIGGVSTGTVYQTTIASDKFSGNGSQVNFTLSRSVVTANDIEVIVNNVQQSPHDGSYSVNGTTLTFSAAPSSGTDNIYVTYRTFSIPNYFRANTTVEGVVALLDSVSNTSVTKAATPNAVKMAYELAGNAVSNASSYAATAYSNAVATANTTSYNQAANAYANAVSHANTVSDTAYTNAVSQANTIAYNYAANAYANVFLGGTFSNTIIVEDVIPVNNSYSLGNSTNRFADLWVSNSSIHIGDVVLTTNTTGLIISNGQLQSTGNTSFTNVTVTGNTIANNVNLNGNLQIDGNLTVGGNTITLNVTELAVEDNMIYLNANSQVSNPDLGFVGNYNDGTYRHAGVFRDATDGTWKFFHQYEPEPDANVFIDTANSTFALANVQANTFIGNLSGDASTVGSNTASDLRNYSANASNISTGTLDTARLPATANVSTAVNVGANVNLTTSSISVGNSTVNTSITSTGFSGPLTGTIGATTPNTGAFTTLSASGVATFSAGTVSDPAITTTGDTNTGIFFPAADTIAFAEGGAEAMRIDSSGNVGIGTTSPQAKLHVGSVAEAPGFGTASEMVYVNGTTQPEFLARKTDIDVVCSLFADGTGGQVRTATNHPLLFSTNNTERMRITSGGDVGIGVTPNDNKFIVKGAHVSGRSIVGLQTSQSASGSPIYLGYFNSADSRIAYVGALTGSQFEVWNAENTFMIFGTNNVERARITAGGYFKATSDSGSYVSSTGPYHELVSNDASNQTFYVYNTSSSYTETIFRPICNRSATNLYSFLIAYSAFTGSSDIEFNLRGDGNAYADGTWNNNGADYAEFFESVNGQALTLGATVVLDGNKVREATDQDSASAIIGVVRPKEPSKASMVVGNTAWNKWANKYLTDDFDRYIMEDHDVVEWEETITDEEGKTSTKQHSYESHNIPAGVTVPADAVRKTHDDKGNKFQHYKLNPAWDKDAEYVNRENRPEWNIIGLLGQVKILKGQPVGDRWIKMRDVSATVEEWMIR